MYVGLAITNICGAKCIFCPSFLVTPKRTMSIDELNTVLVKVRSKCTHLFLNAYGDFLWLKEADKYVKVVSDFTKANPNIKVSLTTNAGWPIEQREKIKNLHVSTIAISFNAAPWNFQQVTGMNYETVRQNIYWMLETFGVVEIHSIFSAYNEISEDELRTLFPNAKIRVSHKIENQLLGHKREKVNHCSYWDGITINPDCSVRLCPHDWLGQTNYADILEEDLDAILNKRQVPQKICYYCNFPDHNNKIYYL